jgi:large subunit ribosomal protein L10
MSRLIKEKIVEKYQARFREVADVAVVGTNGVGVQALTALRRSLRSKGIRALRVQNRLCRRALETTPLAPASSLLHGPSTLIWGADSIVTIAKALSAEAKTVTKLEIRGGVSAGQVLSKEDIETLSKMPSREELLGLIVGRAMGQGARVASLVMSAGGRLVSQVREVEKKAPPPEAAPAEALADKPPVAPGAAPETPAAPEAKPAAPEAPAAPSA